MHAHLSFAQPSSNPHLASRHIRSENERCPKSIRLRNRLTCEDPLDVAAQHLPAEVDGPLFAPAAVDDEPLGQHLGQNPLVHRELRQGELQLVHVAVVADLLGPRHRLQPGGQVVLDVRRRVRVPPVAVGHDVGKDPGVAHQFLVRHARQHRDRERHLREGVEQLLILNQRDAAVVQVLPLIHAAGDRRAG